MVKQPILVLYTKCTRHRMNIVGQRDPLAYVPFGYSWSLTSFCFVTPFDRVQTNCVTCSRNNSRLKCKMLIDHKTKEVIEYETGRKNERVKSGYKQRTTPLKKFAAGHVL